MPAQETPLTLSIVELANTDYSVLKVAVNLLEKSHTKIQILEKGNLAGKVAVIDFDTPAGKEFYAHFDYTHNRLMLLFSTETINDQRNLVLKKPVRVQTIKDVLYDLWNEFQKKMNPTISRATTKTPLIEQPIAVNIDNLLFFLLFKAQQENQIVQIFCPPHSPLFVDTINGVIASIHE